MPSTPSSRPDGARVRRSRLAALAAGLVVLVGGVTAWAVTTSGADQGETRRDVLAGPVTAGTPVPDFTLESLNGKQVTLSDFQGRPVMVNFWASWCHLCREELRVLAELRREHRRLVVIGVTYRDIASDSRAFAKQARAKWPLVVDKNNKVAGAYGVRAIPQTFFIDADGVVRDRTFGLSSPDLKRGLHKILKR
ncbi:MAG: redoxin domain-containing protein [Actinobacteria bacterium]|nr:MAG: redoxin domain-containing protein [Actinomycetota bacterium]